VREVPRVASTISKHPVESGGAPADNIRPEPRTVQIDGVISDAPIREPSTQMDGASGTRRDGVLQFSGALRPRARNRDLLVALVQSGTLVTIRSDREAYEGFVLTRFEAPRNGPTGR
jgi:hypothetical protein